MTVFSHQYGEYNATNSINYFIRNNLGTNVPQWMSWTYGVSQPRTLNFNYPDQPLNFPSFSVTHLGSNVLVQSEGDRADGQYKGIIRQGLMEVNCWTLEILLDKDGKPEGKNEKWLMQLQTMRDMVFLLLQQNRNIQMYDFADPNNPQLLSALVRIKEIREEPVGVDPNPAVKRKRILVTYFWTERWTGGI